MISGTELFVEKVNFCLDYIEFETKFWFKTKHFFVIISWVFYKVKHLDVT